MICIIPARGGSQRIPHKNRKLFHGKPIILYSIETAQKSGLFDEIIVSTDDPDIFEIAMAHGATGYMRPEHLAVDEIGTQAVAKDVLEQVDPKIYAACVIYPTAPLMSADDLKRGDLAMTYGSEMDYAFSVGTEPLSDAGQFYFGKAESFRRGLPLIDEFSLMIPINSKRVCDINTPEDWDRAEKMYGELHEA